MERHEIRVHYQPDETTNQQREIRIVRHPIAGRDNPDFYRLMAEALDRRREALQRA